MLVSVVVSVTPLRFKFPYMSNICFSIFWRFDIVLSLSDGNIVFEFNVSLYVTCAAPSHQCPSHRQIRSFSSMKILPILSSFIGFFSQEVVAMHHSIVYNQLFWRIEMSSSQVSKVLFIGFG